MRVVLLAVALLFAPTMADAGLILHRKHVSKAVVKVGPRGTKAVCRTGVCLGL
jgi:hypothetical protein